MTDIVEKLRSPRLYDQESFDMCFDAAIEIETLRKDIEQLRKTLTYAQMALKPLANAVYNDNGDITVQHSLITYDDAIMGYFAEKQIRKILKN